MGVSLSGDSGSPFIDVHTEMVVGVLSGRKGDAKKSQKGRMVPVTKGMKSQIVDWMNDDGKKWTGKFAINPPPKVLARKVSGDYYDYENEYSFYDEALHNLARAQKQMSVAHQLMRLQRAKKNRNMYK